MTKLYKRHLDLNKCYKDGSYAKDKGLAVTTNPFSIATANEAHFAWIDGFNKVAIEKTPVRFAAVFDTTTTTTSPPLGGFALNTAAFATATNIKSNLRSLNGVDMTQALIDLPAGTLITLINNADETNFATYTTVSQNVTTYATFLVTYVGSAGSLFTNVLNITVQVARP